MTTLRIYSLGIFLLFAINAHGVTTAAPFDSIGVKKLIVMPDTANGHRDWIDAIHSARTSVHLEMYHLTDKAVVDALVSRAKEGGLDMRIILDGKSLTGGYKTAIDALVSAGVQFRPSSAAFSITHAKAMVIDGKTAFVTSINLTNTAGNYRDFGIVTEDSDVIGEMNAVFEADWNNADNNLDFTPELHVPDLAWSPNNSLRKVQALLDSAASSVDAEVENLGSEELIAAFGNAVGRGVAVRLIVPECIFGNSYFNYPYLKRLKDLGIKTQVMHDGHSEAQPYLHAKMMVIDAKINYVGSINFSFNSTVKARELGVIFVDGQIGQKLSEEFRKDWARSTPTDGMPAAGACKK
jgi:phosphatidylserine/phosphatidylglycerophosphate/cardiolipin synthase-like enzyme